MPIGQFNPAIAWELAPVDNNIVAVDNNLIPVGYRGTWKRHTRSGPAFDKIKTLADFAKDLGKFVIAGGACFDAWRYGDVRNDIDIFFETPVKDEIIKKGGTFIKSKLLSGTYPTALSPSDWTLDKAAKKDESMRSISAIDNFFIPNVGLVDVIVVGKVDSVIESFDINLAKYFWNPDLGDIDDCFVKYPTEVALEKVSSPQNFSRHIERMQKYSKVSGLPMTCRIDNFSEAFV